MARCLGILPPSATLIAPAPRCRFTPAACTFNARLPAAVPSSSCAWHVEPHTYQMCCAASAGGVSAEGQPSKTTIPPATIPPHTTDAHVPLLVVLCTELRLRTPTAARNGRLAFHLIHFAEAKSTAHTVCIMCAARRGTRARADTAGWMCPSCIVPAQRPCYGSMLWGPVWACANPTHVAQRPHHMWRQGGCGERCACDCAVCVGRREWASVREALSAHTPHVHIHMRHHCGLTSWDSARRPAMDEPPTHTWIEAAQSALRWRCHQMR